MSVLDRVRRSTTATNEVGDRQSPDSKSTARAARSKIADRIDVVVNELIDYAEKQQDSPFKAHLWLVRSLFSGIADELDGATDDMLAHWMAQFGKLLEWCATGDDSVLPPEVLEYLGKHHVELLAIEAPRK